MLSALFAGLALPSAAAATAAATAADTRHRGRHAHRLRRLPQQPGRRSPTCTTETKRSSPRDDDPDRPLGQQPDVDRLRADRRRLHREHRLPRARQAEPAAAHGFVARQRCAAIVFTDPSGTISPKARRTTRSPGERGVFVGLRSCALYTCRMTTTAPTRPSPCAAKHGLAHDQPHHDAQQLGVELLLDQRHQVAAAPPPPRASSSSSLATSPAALRRRRRPRRRAGRRPSSRTNRPSS